jgi:hypothetical protein
MLDESRTVRHAAASSTLGDLYDVLEENGSDWPRVRLVRSRPSSW